MIVARKKKKENIIEYLLYMFQVEDMIRAVKLDMQLLEQNLISSYKQEPAVLEEIRQWYANHIEMMKDEKKQGQGHLVYIENIIRELEDLHVYLMAKAENQDYKKLYEDALPGIQDLREQYKGNNGGATENMIPGDINHCLDGIYIFLLLKMQGKEISDNTSQAVEKISSMLAFLANQHKRIESGEIEL